MATNQSLEQTVDEIFDTLVKSRFIEMFDALETCALSEYVGSFSGGKSLAGSEECVNKVLNTGSVTFGYFDSNDVKNLPLDYIPNPDHLVKRRDLLVSRMNTPALVGTVAYVNVDLKNTYMPDRLWKAHYKSNSNPIYLWKSLQTDKARMQIISSATGTSGTMKNITKDKMLSIRIPKAPLELQNQFADFYKQVDKSKVICKQMVSMFDDLVKSRFIEMKNHSPCINTLGDFIVPYRQTINPSIGMPILSITKEFGIVLQSNKFKKRIASQDTSNYKVVPKGIIVQGIHIDERNFGVQDIVDFGLVSPAYKLWKVDVSVANPYVIAFAMRSDEVMEQIRAKYRGSIKRRENIAIEDFLKIRVDLPDLKTQNNFNSLLQQVDKSKSAFINFVADRLKYDSRDC